MRLQQLLAAAVGILLLSGTAHAVTISAVPVASVTSAPFPLASFGNAHINGLVSNAPIYLTNGLISFTGGAGLYDGTVAYVAASPTANGANYLVAEPNGSVVLDFASPVSQFQLLWGSVDTYNSLTFFGANGLAATVTGADIQAADNSSQSAYVTISGFGAVSRIVANSSSPAFEFLPDVQVPEPGTLLLLGAGLGGLVCVQARLARSRRV